MADFEMESASDYYSDESDAELQEAFAKEKLKPGLNIEFSQQKQKTNDVVSK